MTWTYDDPLAHPRDAVRLLIGDTDSSDPLITDQEVAYALDLWNDDHYDAGSYLCEVIAAKFAREVTHSADGLSYSASELYRHYSELADRLAKTGKKIRRRGATPYAGGFSRSERIKADQDTDKIPTSFRSSMHDYPGAERFGDPRKSNQ